MTKFILIDFEIYDVIYFSLQHKFPIAILILFIFLHFISFKKGDLIEKISNYKLKSWFILVTLVCIVIVFFYNGNPIDFVYFRF